MAKPEREMLDILVRTVMKDLADNVEKQLLETSCFKGPMGRGLVIPGKEEFVAVLEYEQYLSNTPDVFNLNVGVRRRDDDRMVSNYGYFAGNHKDFLDYVRIPTCDYPKLCDQIIALCEKLESLY